MNIPDRLKFFSGNYDLISDGIYSSGPRQYVGSKATPRKCRFCDLPNPTFATEAHAIPECLGNHQLILHEECDVCNKFFSEKLEDHLDKYTKPFRTLTQIKGKKKVPTYKSKDHSTRIQLGQTLVIKTYEDSDHIQIDEENSSVKLKLDLEPHIPAAAYKALVKIALSTITDNSELEAFKLTILWLKELDHRKAFLDPQNLMVTFVPGEQPTPGVVSKLFRRKPSCENNVPYCVYVIAFGNFVYQLIVPSHLDGKSGAQVNFALPYFPAAFESNWKFGIVARSIENMLVTEKVLRTRTLNLGAERIEKM